MSGSSSFGAATGGCRTRAETEMTGTATTLRMVAKLTAWEGDAVVFESSFDDEVARRFV